MSWKATNAILENSPAKGSELLMLLVLSNYADENHETFPSIPKLARDTRMSARQVTRIIAKLEAMGEIKTLHKGTGRTPSRYRINLRGVKMSVLDVTPALTQLCHPSPDKAMSPELPSGTKNGTTINESVFLEGMKQCFPHLDIDAEVRKMKAWLLTPRGAGRRLTRNFMQRWLSRQDKPLELSSRQEKPRQTRTAAERGYSDPRNL